MTARQLTSRALLVLVLLCGSAVGLPGAASAATVSTGGAGTSYYDAYYSGSWHDLQTPPHTVDGQIAYCLEQAKDFPINNSTYGLFDAAALYNFNTYVGLQSILHRGYPYVTPAGLTATQARYATANAIRAWMREAAGVGYVFMDMSTYTQDAGTWSRLRPASGLAGSEQMFRWTIDLVTGARNRVLPARSVSAAAITLRPNADYTRLVGQTTVSFNDLNGYYTVDGPPGVSLSGYTGGNGDVLTVSVPCTPAWIGQSVALTLYAYDSRVPANIFYYAPGDTSYQRVVSAQASSFQVSASAAVPVGSGSGALRITKTDVVDGAPLDGAVFELLWNSTVVASGTTDAAGDLTFTGLAPGTWTVREQSAPQGYLLDVTPHSVAVPDGGTGTIGLTNERALRPVRVLKAGEAGEPLAGAVYEIREEGGSVVATLTTNADGTAESEPLQFGDYELVETVAPLGHVLDPTPYAFTIDRMTPVTLEISRMDVRARGTVRIEKRSDGQDARLLPGAVYEIWRVRDTSPLVAPFDPAEDPTDPVATLTTDAQGVARSELLEYGCYYAVETTAPVGHALNPTRHFFEIREDEAVISLELTDDVLPVNHGGVMLRYRNIWDGTEIAKAWGYNAEIGTEYMSRVRAEGLDKMPIEGFSYVTADYAPYTELVDGKLLVTYWYRQTLSGDWLKVRTGDDGRARLTAKDREAYGLLSDAELYSRLLEAKAANPDVIGYLSIPGTDLHEPVVQTTDNVKYLTHAADGDVDARGAIFADYRSPRYAGDSSRATLLHGHNMRDGSMLGVLASYGDADFWAAHPFIQYVDAAGNGGTWLVYSARVADGSDDAFAFPVMRPYSDRIARWADRSILDPGFRPDPAGRTLTLSTCAYHVEDGKLLVHAELIEGYSSSDADD
ncbi:MAG: SpaA isopeptide-forming pilin-related protein [Coriobacteriia bacterium]|nr:SpaA isopeptide-forming pilin-related protein [Coriobacteriia bacterium]